MTGWSGVSLETILPTFPVCVRRSSLPKPNAHPLHLMWECYESQAQHHGRLIHSPISWLVNIEMISCNCNRLKTNRLSTCQWCKNWGSIGCPGNRMNGLLKTWHVLWMLQFNCLQQYWDSHVYVCMYVCMYVYAYIHIHIYITPVMVSVIKQVSQHFLYRLFILTSG